jgi:ABC-type sugar transport system ATPase subunit
MAEVRVVNVTKAFGDFQAVRNVSLRFLAHSTTCVLGPSGCGKTTLLRMIAGLETPSSGSIEIGGKDLTDQPPRRRPVAMVFQYSVIYRGLSVAENIGLPLKELKLSPAERATRINNAVTLLGLKPCLDMDPDRFDMGTRQRIAFARAIARESAVILFDEPLTNVDPEAKFRLKQDLKKITERLGQTIIYVTHDQNEAMTLADQIVLLKDGEILQQDKPRQIYDHPKQHFGGWFLGSPGMSFLEHSVNSAEGGVVQSDLFPFSVRLSKPLDQSGKVGLRVGIRPEKLRVSVAPQTGWVSGTVRRKFRGVAGQYLVAIQLRKHLLWAKVHSQLGKDLGSMVWIKCEPSDVVLFDDDGRALSNQLVRSGEGH